MAKTVQRLVISRPVSELENPTLEWGVRFCTADPTGEKTVTTHCNHNGRQGPRWSREQIRAARLAPLVPLIQKRGLQLIVREADNYPLPAYPGLIIKDSYWPKLQPPSPGERITRGFKVRRHGPQLAPHERKSKEQIAHQILSEVMECETS